MDTIKRKNQTKNEKKLCVCVREREKERERGNLFCVRKPCMEWEKNVKFIVRR